MPADNVLNQFSVTMPTDRTADFTAPWCKAILEDPQWQQVPFGWLVATDQPMHLNQFWNNTLSSTSALRAVQGLCKSKINTQEDAPDVMMLMSLGGGLAGAPDRLHGGFTATALDMITGFAVNGAEAAVPISTAMLKVDYKAPVPVPSIVIAKAWNTGKERRKRWVRATFEDGNGKVLAAAEAIYVVLTPKV